MRFLLILLFFAVPAAGGQLSPNISGLIGYWKFNEGTGTTIVDYSSYGRNMTNGNMGWANGIFSNCVYGGTSGPGAYTNTTIATPPYITMMAWINLPSSYSLSGGFVVQQPVSNTGDTSPYHNASISSQRHATSKYISGSVNVANSQRTANCVVPLSFFGRWHHIAVTYDGKMVRLYSDAVLCGTYAYAGTIVSVNTPFYVSGYRPGSTANRGVDGIVDELALFNRALSAGEIQHIYSEGIGRYSHAR